MAFMEPDIQFGHWYEVDGPSGTEFIPADLVGKITVTHPDGHETTHFPDLDELQELDRVTGDTEDESDSVRFAIPSALREYCENREAWRIDLITGYGCRLSAPGYMDCTSWSVFDSEQEAKDYLTEMYADEQEGEEGELLTPQPTPEGDLFVVALPGDLFETMEELAAYAIDYARDNAADYVMPATWTATHVKGDLGDNEITFNVLRKGR